MSDIWTVFAIIGVVVLLFIWDRLPVIAVCMTAALLLWATGILTLNQSLAGFGDPAIIFVATLFVVSAGLEATGVTAWAGQILIRQAGESRTRLIVLMMGVTGLLSGLISVNGAVASLLPVVVVMAIRLGQSPSQLLMPLVFAAHAGSQILLTGSPVNVLVSEASLEAGGGGFGYLEFALVGIPLIAGSILIVVLFGRALLPERTSATLPPDLSRHAMTLIEQYRLATDVHHLRVREDSPLVGTARRRFDLSGREGLALVTLKEADGLSARRDTIRQGDVVVVRGPAEAAAELVTELGLSFTEDDPPDLEKTLFNRQSGLAEIQIPPRSKLVGERFFPGMVTESGDLIVLAVQRHGEDLDPSEPLAVGDTLLLQGTWPALEARLKPAEVLMVNSPDLVRRQALPMGPGAWNMLAILGAMVVLLATGLVPPAIAGVLAAGAVLLSGIQSVDQVYRAINWTTIILMGAMMPLSTAMQQTGAADLLATGLVDMIGDAGPHLLLAGLFVLSGVMGQIISNTATALIVIPIAVVAAAQMGVSPQPILMAVCLASAAAFLTPVATPTNLMVMEPGAYRFGDYWKLGLPLMIWFFVIAVVLVPIIWPF
ncbi:anion permease [Cereibacter azotoformans]|uniref:RCK C-terminal domain-containing protein n=1 Tax=Cereibacter sphaeroides (strain ATCC 17025 / ATH 2.4.3) TaxID=349102 RepID=A4WY81_CERS5|nr:SLC13 family permease [Cereibacter azotoformans]ULB11787.1 anion permease [Cereibacter azotoformans]